MWTRVAGALSVCMAAAAVPPPAGSTIICTQVSEGPHLGHLRCGAEHFALVHELEHSSAPRARVLQEREDEHTVVSESHAGEVTSECECGEEENVAAGSAEFWLYVMISALLVCSAGLFSGLTIGLMSLDLSELKRIQKANVNPRHPRNKEYASIIIPLLEDHHLLLVSLLLSNAAAMEALPIFLDKISPSPLVAILMSVTLVLFFGEVIPQALCKAYGLAIGATTAPAVHCLIKLLFPVAKPIAILLDRIFGHEVKIMRRTDWFTLLDMLAEDGQNPDMVEMHKHEAGEMPLTPDELSFMRGVLGIFEKRVSSLGRDECPIMVLLNDVYSLQLDDRLSEDKVRVALSDTSIMHTMGTMALRSPEIPWLTGDCCTIR